MHLVQVRHMYRNRQVIVARMLEILSRHQPHRGTPTHSMTPDGDRTSHHQGSLRQEPTDQVTASQWPSTLHRICTTMAAHLSRIIRTIASPPRGILELLEETSIQMRSRMTAMMEWHPQLAKGDRIWVWEIIPSEGCLKVPLLELQGARQQEVYSELLVVLLAGVRIRLMGLEMLAVNTALCLDHQDRGWKMWQLRRARGLPSRLRGEEERRGSLASSVY